MRFPAFAFWMTILPVVLLAENELNPKHVEDALHSWFPATCAQKPIENPQMTLVLECASTKDPTAAPLFVGAATLSEWDFANQVNAIATAAQKKKAKHSKNDWDAKLEARVMRQERSPRGRLGFYGAHPGVEDSALSFIVIDPTTRQSLQLMYTFRPAPHGEEPINWAATHQSREAIFENLKHAGFALEKRYWR
jgi:hypothetical protein